MTGNGKILRQLRRHFVDFYIINNKQNFKSVEFNIENVKKLNAMITHKIIRRKQLNVIQKLVLIMADIKLCIASKKWETGRAPKPV
jgi:hypothetical protein